jgi:hypothetical protein
MSPGGAFPGPMAGRRTERNILYRAGCRGQATYRLRSPNKRVAALMMLEKGYFATLSVARLCSVES